MKTYSELIDELKFYKKTHWYYQLPKNIIIDGNWVCMDRLYSSDIRHLSKFIRQRVKEKKLNLEETFFNYTIDDIYGDITLIINTYDYDYTPKPTHSVDDLLDQGYSLRQIQQIMKGEN